MPLHGSRWNGDVRVPDVRTGQGLELASCRPLPRAICSSFIDSQSGRDCDVRVGSYTLSMSENLESLGERIAEQAAHLDAALHRLLTDLRAFDRGGGWHTQGARSCAHWL